MESPDRIIPVERWVASPVDSAVEKSLERIARSRGVRRVAVMPDVHLAEEVCVGVVLGTDTTLYPGAVGGDIGCGMAAVGFDGEAHGLRDERIAARLLSAFADWIPANKHGPSTIPSGLPAELEALPLSETRLERLKHREGLHQLGTLGRGNHFLELQEDQEARLWLMLHSGSRAMGQAIRDHHLSRASHGAELPYLEADSDAGRAYHADHLWAIRYAASSRRQMAERACEIIARVASIEADWESYLDCDHNHVQPEVHFGERLWVHRKGALAAHDGTRGMIPGSMGTASYHVTGRGHEPALRSSSHGAGRRLSRSEARRRISPRALEQEMDQVLFDHRMARGLCEEAPGAYKDIDRVMRAQRELIRIDRKLRPVLVYKGR